MSTAASSKDRGAFMANGLTAVVDYAVASHGARRRRC